MSVLLNLSRSMLPLERLELADDAFEQCGLAGAVRADDGEQIAMRHLAIDVMHGGMPVIAEREIAEDDGRASALHAHANAHEYGAP